MAEDLIQAYCKGGSKHDDNCEHFVVIGHECELLKAQVMEEIFAKGRCLPEKNLVRSTVSGILYRFHDLIKPQDCVDEITVSVTEDIKKHSLTEGHKLCVLKGYINKTAYHKIVKMLMKETDTITKRVCRDCFYLMPLSKDSDPICQRVTIDSNEEGEDIPNSHYQKKRGPSDSACQGFRHIIIVSIETVPDSVEGTVGSGIQAVNTIDEIDFFRKLLKKRIQLATTPKRKEINLRQFTIFCRLEQLFQQAAQRNEAVKQIAEELKVSKNSVYRDIQDIAEYLRKKNVMENENGHLDLAN